MSEPFTSRAGAGRAALELHATDLPIDGFGSQIDQLHVRALLLEDATFRAVILSIEMTSLPALVVEDIAAQVSRLADTDVQNVWVTATHTFSAPHLPPSARLLDADPLSIALRDAVRSATEAAVSSIRPARLSSGTGTARVAVNRDVETPAGWWLGADDSGFTDPEVAVVRFEDEDGDTIAVLFSTGVQSSIMNGVESDGGRLISADLAGAAARLVEQRYDRSVALFLIGPAGDQAPYLVAFGTSDGTSPDLEPATIGRALVHLLGQRLAEVVISTVQGLTSSQAMTLDSAAGAILVPGQVAPHSFRDLAPSRDYTFQPDVDQTVPFWVLRAGTVTLLGLRPELSSSTGTWIKRHRPDAVSIVATMVNGGAKYLPDAGSYDRRTYEAMSSRYARGAAELVAARLAEALEGTRGSGSSSRSTRD